MNRQLRYTILTADLLWIAAAFLFTHLLRKESLLDRDGMLGTRHAAAILAALFTWAMLFFGKRLEGFRSGWALPNMFAQVTVGVCYLMGLLLMLASFTKASYSRLDLLYFGCLLPVGFIGARVLSWRLAKCRTGVWPKRQAVILGNGRTARELACKIRSHPELSMEVAGILFPSEVGPRGQVSPLSNGMCSIRSLNVVDLMLEKNVKELIVVEPIPPGRETENVLLNCRKAGIRVHLVPQHYQLYLSKARLEEIDDVPLISLEEPVLPAVGLELKRVMDILGALLLLTLCAPLLAFSAVALSSRKAKPFRKELRCGKDEVLFWMYRLNIDRDVPEIEGYARFLVQFSLTELPQLWNVLKGEMGLVGPRPESPERVKHYSVWQRQRLRLRPGLTGLAQVSGLREQHSSEEKARFDLQYIFHWSLFLDLSLLLQTAWALLVRMIKEEGVRVTSVQATLGAEETPNSCREGELGREPAWQAAVRNSLASQEVMHAHSAQSGAD